MLPLDSEDLFTRDVRFLQQALREYLNMHAFTSSPTLAADIVRLLQAPGKLLSFTPISVRIPVGFWALLPLSLVRYFQPDADPLLCVRVVLCCELLLCALDYFDELQDNDQSSEREELGDGRVLNAAYTLTILARCTLSDLPDAHVARERRDRLLSLLDEELFVAVQGQHQDLLSETQPLSSVTPETCLELDAQKSGALVRLACRLASMAVATSQEVEHLVSEMGTYIGTAFQLENDTHDLEQELDSSLHSGKSDLVREKKTYPIVLAAQQMTALQLQAVVADKENEEGHETNALRERSYREAIRATLGVALYLRSEAETLAFQMEERQGRRLSRELCMLLGLETRS